MIHNVPDTYKPYSSIDSLSRVDDYDGNSGLMDQLRLSCRPTTVSYNNVTRT